MRTNDLAVIKVQVRRAFARLMHKAYTREIPWTRLFTIYQKCQNAAGSAKTPEAAIRLYGLARNMSEEGIV